jgi:hypothetical protein
MAATGEPAELRSALIALSDEARLLAAQPDPRPLTAVARRQQVAAERERHFTSGC